MDFAVRDCVDIARLSVEQVTERLGYVDKALRLLRKELGDQTALIGFSGSPWTIATFMMEGGSAEKYTRALALFRLVCDFGTDAAGRGCFDAGAYYEDRNDNPHAIAFYQRACNKKDAEACERLGVLRK